MRPLSFLSPSEWLATYPQWRFDRPSKKWIHVPPPRRDDRAREFESYVLGAIDSHALRILNRDGPPANDDARRRSWEELEVAAVAAGRHVGVRFVPGRQRHVMAGVLSADWLRERAIPTAFRFALLTWDPETGAVRRRQIAAAGGRASKRPPTFTADMLRAVDPELKMSIRAQAEALACSRRTVCRLRREVETAG